MGDRPPLKLISASIASRLVSYKFWGDAAFINLPMAYPSGAQVTVRITEAPGGFRVSDAGFAYREIESYGAGRSFGRSVRSVVDAMDLNADRRTIYIDVPPEQVERAIFDVSAASFDVASKIVQNATVEGEAQISDNLLARLDSIFDRQVDHDGKIVGASATEWEVTAIAKLDGKRAVFQAVPNFPVSVYKASTAFVDIGALGEPPTLVSVVSDKAAMGKHYSILSRVGRVIEVGQDDETYLRAVA